MRCSFLPGTCTAPAEKVHAGPGNGLAGPCIRDEVVGLAFERFLEDHRVIEPDHDAARVSALDLRGEQIRAGLLKGRGDGDPAIEMAGTRFEIEVPAGDRPPEVLLLIHCNETRADVADIDLLPVELPGPGRDVVLDIFQ